MTNHDRWRALGFDLIASTVTMLAIGKPTAVITNPVFARMAPVRPWDYAVLALTALLSGALVATYALPTACSLQDRKLLGGGVLSLLAIGCPTCDKFVVLPLGASGALTYFEPAQPLLVVASLALLGLAVVTRLRGVHAGSAAAR